MIGRQLGKSSLCVPFYIQSPVLLLDEASSAGAGYYTDKMVYNSGIITTSSNKECKTFKMTSLALYVSIRTFILHNGMLVQRKSRNSNIEMFGPATALKSQ